MSYSFERFAYIFFVSISISQFGIAQQPGELDVGFAANGFVTLGEPSSRNDEARSLLIRPDGKILVVGKVSSLSGQDNDIVISQVMSDGVLDNAFGQNGVVVTNLGGTSDIGQDLLFTENQTIMIAAGSNQSGVFESTLLRYDQFGVLDPTFGVNGASYVNIAGAESGLFSLASTENGKFFGGGSVGSDIYVAKFNSDGSFDNGFANSGVQQASLSAVDGVAGRIKVLNGGKLMALTNGSEIGESLDAYIWRMNDDGSWDDSFNGIGWHNLSLSDGADAGYDLEVLGDGRVIVSGAAFNVSDMAFEMVVLRLLSDGTYDNTFGVNGEVRFDIGLGSDFAYSLVLQPDGKIIIGGSANDGNDDNFCIIRINEDGSLDPSFGNNGVVITEISAGYDAIADMELQSDGKLVVGGTARVGNNDDIVLARYHTGLNTSVVEVADRAEISVYPNPATDLISISAKVKLQRIELIDALGRSVLFQGANALQIQIDISSLPNGIYLLRATDGERMFAKQVVKE
jgi:uncharacterized delta-60 repeat protein